MLNNKYIAVCDPAIDTDYKITTIYTNTKVYDHIYLSDEEKYNITKKFLKDNPEKLQEIITEIRKEKIFQLKNK